MTLNADLIRARCEEIDRSIERLTPIGALPAGTFLASRDTVDIACYRLLLAIESALSLCYHVSARRLRRTPDDYAACFQVLGENDLIPADLSDRLQRLVRLRNLLVHVYWNVDHAAVHEAIRAHLGDLRQFADTMRALI